MSIFKLIQYSLKKKQEGDLKPFLFWWLNKGPHCPLLKESIIFFLGVVKTHHSPLNTSKTMMPNQTITTKKMLLGVANKLLMAAHKWGCQFAQSGFVYLISQWAHPVVNLLTFNISQWAHNLVKEWTFTIYNELIIWWKS